MGTRQGTLLEENTLKIFELAGFEVKHQHRINGYEIDNYVKKDNLTIACECKQYERSDINIKNLIHLWNSKSKEINVSRILLVFYGIKPSPQEYNLAKKYGIVLWDSKDIHNYLDLLINDRKKGSKILLEDFKSNKISKAKEDDSFENIIPDNEVPLTDYIKVSFNDRIIIDEIKTNMEGKNWGLDSNPVRTTELDLFFINPSSEKIMSYYVKNKFDNVSKVTAIWLNSNKEIIRINPNQLLDKGVMNRFHYFRSGFEARYCFLLVGKESHNDLKVRDKLNFIEVK